MGLTRREALDVLGLKDGATDKEIKDRFKQLALKWHPDKNPDDPKAAEEKFQKLTAAYSHLKHEDEEDQEYEYDAISLAELLLEMFGRGFMYSSFVPAPQYCSCPNCQMNSEWMEDRLEMMEEEGYSDLSDDDDEDSYIMEERFPEEMYRREIFEEERQKEYIRDYHEATAKVIGDRLVKQFADKLYYTYNQPSRTSKKESTPRFRSVSREEATRNAEQLLEAEEKAKREREKKRERNKKKKQAKKKRKATQQKEQRAKAPPPEIPKVKEIEESGQEDDQEAEASDSDEFDVNSAFIARASKKQSAAAQKPRPSPKDSSPSSNTGTVSSSTSLHSAEGSPTHSQSALHTLDPEVAENDLAQSRRLASLGNRAAKDGHYGEAVRRYTEAIELYPYDHRYFGNRSYCYDLLQNYASALEDANRAIALDVSWAKGYYRQGRAFAGLKRLELAEGSYIQALRYDPQYQDAMDELVKIRVEQLKGMGFSLELCEAAVKEFGTVQASIDALLAGKVAAPVPEGDVYQEPSPPPPDPPQVKPTRERFKLPPRMQARASQPEPQQPKKAKPSANSDKRSLWVGNITSDDITEEMLTDLFKQYGPVSSVKLLTPRHCAFINYQKPGSAAQALKHLQGHHLGGSYLLVRYPETSNKNPYMQNMKKPGPVNGTECYYWRTTGCSFGIRCRYDHIPENKGADLPAMM